MCLNEKKTESTVEEVNVLKESHKVWKEEQQKENINFKKIVKEQAMANNTAITDKVIKVIKEKPEVVIDTVEKKKSVVLAGIKEEFLPRKQDRDKQERKIVGEVLEAIQEEGDLVCEIDEVFRLGKYKSGFHRPIKIRFKSQVAAEEAVSKAWKLSKIEVYKGVWLRKDRSKEERNVINSLREQAKEKNEARSEDEKKKFFYRVMDMDLRKWFIRDE